jgi:hypothetical protein
MMKAKLFFGYCPALTLTAFRKKPTEMEVKVNSRKEFRKVDLCNSPTWGRVCTKGEGDGAEVSGV